MTLTKGLSIGENTLGINGAISGSGGLTGGINSNITVGGNGASTTLPAVEVYDFTMSRANGITLSGDLTIDHSLTLTSGIINTGTDNKVNFGIFATNPSETTSSRIDGTSVMLDRTVGMGAIYFLNCFISTGTDNLGTVKITRKTGTNGIITYNGTSGIQSNWDIISTNPPTAGRNVTYEWLPVYDPVPPFNTGTLADIYYSSNAGVSWNLTGNSVDPTFYSPSLRGITLNTTHFSIWTVTRHDAPLPLQLTSFSSSLNGRDVYLKWTTVKEINNSGFDVERKTDGNNNWSKITFISGKGNSNTPVQYSYDDKKLNTGKYNYRLKQIDNNGNIKYYGLSNTIEIELPMKYNISQNYPNPFNPETKIDFDLPYDSRVSIILYDISGRELMTLVNEQRSAGYYTVQINGNNLGSGIYFYRIIAQGNEQKYFMIKKAMLIK